MVRRLEGTHTEFLQLIMGKRERLLGDGTWEMPKLEGVQKKAGNQSERIYIERQQTTVAQCVALCPSFEVCAKETWYKAAERRRNRWWQQK